MQSSEEILFQVSHEQILKSLGFSACEAKVLMDADALLPDGTVQITESVLQKIPFELFFKEEYNFNFVVPDDYNHDTQVDSTIEEARKNKYVKEIDENFTDNAFSRVSDKLLPGKKYQARIFRKVLWLSTEIQEADDWTSRDGSNQFSVLFLKKHKALFTGAQGLTLMWNLKGAEFFGYHKTFVSFDDKDLLNLAQKGPLELAGRYPGVPRTLSMHNKDIRFGTQPWFRTCGQFYRVLCITTSEEE